MIWTVQPALSASSPIEISLTFIKFSSCSYNDCRYYYLRLGAFKASFNWMTSLDNELQEQGMSASCCGQDNQFDGVSAAFKRALWIVIAINGAMFIVEMAAGAFAGSKALQADALDFLGDTTTYAISLYVIGMALHVRATAALIKGLSLAAMGLWVFGSTAYQVLVLGVPSATVMGGVGLLALLANLASVVLLMRFKDGDANVRSVWLCSRNDAIGNVAVIGAAAGVYFTGTAWPDLIVAALMAGLFLWSATQIVRQAWGEMQHCAVPATGDGLRSMGRPPPDH
jgi:Co/Zn/Cd efflux system component